MCNYYLLGSQRLSPMPSVIGRSSFNKIYVENMDHFMLVRDENKAKIKQ